MLNPAPAPAEPKAAESLDSPPPPPPPLRARLVSVRRRQQRQPTVSFRQPPHRRGVSFPRRGESGDDGRRQASASTARRRPEAADAQAAEVVAAKKTRVGWKRVLKRWRGSLRSRETASRLVEARADTLAAVSAAAAAFTVAPSPPRTPPFLRSSPRLRLLPPVPRDGRWKNLASNATRAPPPLLLSTAAGTKAAKSHPSASWTHHRRRRRHHHRCRRRRWWW